MKSIKTRNSKDIAMTTSQRWCSETGNLGSRMSYYQYIDPRELVEIFQQDNVAIIDVRDEDFDENGFCFIALPSHQL
jgi:hypothetical protein